MRQLISVIVLCLMMACSSEAFSQRQRLESTDFLTFASASFRETQFKDSNALYTTIVQILVDSKHPSKIQISVSNAVPDEIMKSIKTFKDFNFSPLMNKYSQVAFQVPISIMIANSKQETSTIELETLSSSIAKMFNFRALDDKGFHVIELFPIISIKSLMTYD